MFVQLKSFAKINLGLEIIDKRTDGYHNLKTVFQTVDLFDLIEIRENKQGVVRISGDEPTIEWNQHNTIHQAAELVYKNFSISQGLDISVKKRIPAGSGLGGGSSNAAVILMFLNQYFQLNLSLEEMIGLGATIGADVPFFFLGGTVLAEGIGEIMTPLETIDELHFVIVVPAISVSTRLIFSHLRLTTTPINSKIKTFMLSRNLKLLENRLENITFQLFPEVGNIKMRMSKLGFDLVLMSGSGSAVYGASSKPITHLSLQQLQAYFPGSRVFMVQAVDRPGYLNRIGASPSGKASVFGADIRWFKSIRPSML